MASGVLCCVGDWPETWAQAPAPVQAVANSQAASWCTVTVTKKSALGACIFQELAAESPAGAALQKNFLRTREAQELLRSCWALASTAVKEMCSELGASWTMLGGAGRSCWAMLGRRGAGLGFQRRPEGVPFTIAFRSENARQHLHSGACATEPEEAREGPAYEEIYGMRLATTVRRSQPGAERALPWEQGATRGGGASISELVITLSF